MPSQMCRLLTDTPYTNERPFELLNFTLVTIWMVLYFFGPLEHVHYFHKQSERLTYQTTIHASTMHHFR